MSTRDKYPAGVPCWVDTLQANVRAATDFYGALFGWEFVGPGPMPGDPPGEYYVARMNGRDVAGIGSAPASRSKDKPAWNTYVRVDSADDAARAAKAAGGQVLDGPLDVPPAGRLAVIADSTGAVFGLWEAREREGAQVINEPRAWAMSVVHSSEPDRALAFYGKVFGWRAEPFGPPGAQMILLRLPGYVGGEPLQPVPRDLVAVMLPIADRAPAHWSVGFWIGDADGAAAKAAKLGGKVLVAPHDTPGFREVVLADPQGAAFSLSQLMAAKR